MMKKDYLKIARLISREKLGIITASEKTELEEMLLHDAEYHDIYDSIEEISVEDKYQQRLAMDNHVSWNRLNERIKTAQRRRKIRRISWTAAAAVIVVGCLWLFRFMPERPEKVLSLYETILPGEQKAILWLVDGRKVELKKMQSMLIETEEGSIHIDSVGVVCGEESERSAISGTNYNKLVIPRGGEYHIVLADGTDVWLNSETELRFPLQFDGESRQVYVRGEAYFDVKADPERPFIVRTAAGDVKVLGTSFGILNYDTTTLVATLEIGLISYVGESRSEVVIHPGEQLTYTLGDESPRVKKVNTRLYTAWKDNLFCFEEQRLSEIMEILTRWYDLEVRFESEELKDVELSGTLNRYSDVRPLLNLFELGAHVKFEIKGNIIIVRK